MSKPLIQFTFFAVSTFERNLISQPPTTSTEERLKDDGASSEATPTVSAPEESANKQSSKDERGWKALMFSAQAGDKQAYGQLLAEIQPVLSLFVKQRVSSAADGDDIVQEIMMGLHRNRHTFNGESSFEAWMFSIARFKLIDYIRKKKRKSENETTTEEVIEGSVPAEHFQDAEAVETLKAALGKLPEKQRLIVEAMKFRGESVKEVADELSMSEAAVRVNAHRAYKKIKAALLGDDSNDET